MAARPDDGRRVWAIALTPVLLLLVTGALARLRLPVALAVPAGGLVAFGTAVLLARRDTRAAATTGQATVPAGWAVVPWLFLGMRAARRGAAGASTWLPALACLLVWGFSLLVLAPLADGLDPGGRYDRAKLEAELTAGIKGRTGLDVTVTCPADQSLANGADFRCTLTGAGGSSTVEVIVTDSAGSYTWRLD